MSAEDPTVSVEAPKSAFPIRIGPRVLAPKAISATGRAYVGGLHGGLTLKQRAFAECYLGRAEGSGKDAALMAGYTTDPRYAASLAYKLLRNPKVVRYIERKLKQRMVMRGDEVLGELTKAARVDVPISERGKLKALELMAKHHRLVGDEGAVNIQQNTVVTVSQLSQRIDGYAAALRSGASAHLLPPEGAHVEDEALDNDAPPDFTNTQSVK